MLPQLLWNLNRIHDFLTDILRQQGRTGEFMGPWSTKMNYLVTSDPINVHHIMSKSFDNYVKGPEFRDIFQAFGDGIFATDFERWRYHRMLLHSVFKNRSFEMFLEKTIKKKVANSLIPVLENVLQQRVEVDLQDIFNRFTFDNICNIILGYDPNCLAIDHLPELQKWLQIGQERKMSQACKTFDQFLYSIIATKRKELSKCTKIDESLDHVDLLTSLMMRGEEEEHVDKFLRDLAFNLFVAGRDTITSALIWFFWLTTTNPLVEAKILDEIKENFGANNDEMKHKVFGIKEVEKLVYLHGALCESLRLFPPIPFERKQPIKCDILPSGHHVKPSTMILLSLLAMGRFEEIWRKDCLEFKSERWISNKGRIVHVPSYKILGRVMHEGPNMKSLWALITSDRPLRLCLIYVSLEISYFGDFDRVRSLRIAVVINRGSYILSVLLRLSWLKCSRSLKSVLLTKVRVPNVAKLFRFKVVVVPICFIKAANRTVTRGLENLEPADQRLSKRCGNRVGTIVIMGTIRSIFLPIRHCVCPALLQLPLPHHPEPPLAPSIYGVVSSPLPSSRSFGLPFSLPSASRACLCAHSSPSSSKLAVKPSPNTLSTS
ncbi:hypothetical protein PIB30_042839 [Stylosanthes scabra]|uniref:Cytochrome P450 n=1 Tax=Stylosanthes scabra TaxID=79078 RepID=A0ABU6WFC3_9FABA|nr:hypothetical protein [Stylosanthes scabra]